MTRQVAHFPLKSDAWAILLFPLLLICCTASTSQTPTPTVTVSPSASPPTVTATHTPSPVPSVTAIPSITPSPTPTPTYLPTLPSIEIPETVLGLYATNGGCLLPCWWGIVPGETPWESARGFLEPFALEINKFINDLGQLYYYSHFRVPKDINLSEDVNIYFRINDDNIVDFIGTANPWRITNPEYSLSYMLSTYGVPTEIRLGASANTPATGRPYYTYYLFYFKLGILAASSNEANLLEDSLALCPQYFSETPNLYLWDPNLELTFDYLYQNGFLRSTYLPPKLEFLQIEDVSNFNVDRFYETYLDQKASVCIETPLEFWD